MPAAACLLRWCRRLRRRDDKAVAAILVAFSGLAKTSQEYIIINYVSDTIFYFLPIYLGVTAASYFGCNKYIAAAVTAMFVHPAYVGLVSAGEARLRFSACQGRSV